MSKIFSADLTDTPPPVTPPAALAAKVEVTRRGDDISGDSVAALSFWTDGGAHVHYLMDRTMLERLQVLLCDALRAMR